MSLGAPRVATARTSGIWDAMVRAAAPPRLWPINSWGAARCCRRWSAAASRSSRLEEKLVSAKLTLALPQAGEVEAQHTKTTVDQSPADPAYRLEVFRAGEAVGEERDGLRILAAGGVETGRELVPKGPSKSQSFAFHVILPSIIPTSHQTRRSSRRGSGFATHPNWHALGLSIYRTRRALPRDTIALHLEETMHRPVRIELAALTDLDATLARLDAANVTERLWAKDHTLWRQDPTEISNRLGWLDLARDAPRDDPELVDFPRRGPRRRFDRRRGARHGGVRASAPKPCGRATRGRSKGCGSMSSTRPTPTGCVGSVATSIRPRPCFSSPASRAPLRR